MHYNAECTQSLSEILTWPVFTSLPQPQPRDTTLSRAHGDTGWNLHDQMANTSPFQTVSELQSAHLDSGYLSVQSYSSAHTTSVQQSIWISAYFFLGLFLLDTPSFSSLHSNPTRWHIYAHNCSITAEHSLFFFFLFINTTSLQHSYMLLHFFLVLTMSTMTQKFATEQNSSQVFIFRKMFDKGRSKHNFSC